nr:hypothetical protein [Tanacetum cinerariifolium]
KPHDESNTKVPEGSRNPNSTASSFNPPADQMETLTLESPIPTISSPILTACLNDSLEPSSEARLISKRVSNQEETPSLDNILSLTNSWVEAMKEELLQFKIQKVWTLFDCPKGVRPIGTKWVLKNKKDERGIVVRNKARLVAQGHTQGKGLTMMKEFEALMHEKFQMSAMGELNFFLGLQVLQKEDGIFLSKDKYIGDILKKFRYSNVRSLNTPMDKENPWGKDGTGKDVDLHLYRSMIRSLMYLTASRPDIMFAVCACARHQTIVATSTTKAEYVAAASCCGQVLWF